MNCFECANQGHVNPAVVAICSQCGAATCIDHTVAGHAYAEVSSLGSMGHRELPGRRLYCPGCGVGAAERGGVPMVA